MTTMRLVDDRVSWREVDDGQIVALDLTSSVYFTVNRTGTVLWPRLAAGATRDELVDEVCGRWELPREDASRDVDSFIAMLDERGLLARA